MEEFDIAPFLFVRKLLSMSGIWPYLTTTQRFARVIIMSASLIAAYSVQVTNLLSMRFRIQSSVLYTAYLFTTTSISIAYYYCLLKRKLILYYLENIMNDWNDIRQMEQLDVLLRYAFLYRKCIFMFILSYNSYVSVVFLSSLKPLLLDLITPSNETRPRTLIIPMTWYTGQYTHFLKILIFQFDVMMILGLGLISGLSICILILQHICAMFHITGYIDLYNTVFNVPSFVQLICALCFIGIAIISILDEFENSSDINSLALPIIYVIFHLIWVFVFCHIGQEVENISKATFYKAYEIPWYLFSKQSKQLILFVIARSYKPANITIGKMFQLTHEFFAGLVQLSISYAITLHSIRR